MTAAAGTRGMLADVIHRHLPKDRYDEEGTPVGTYCTGCEWEGDYFADGEAGPFDDHLTAAVLAWLADALADEGTRKALAQALQDDPYTCWDAEDCCWRTLEVTLAALRERLGVDGGEEVPQTREDARQGDSGASAGNPTGGIPPGRIGTVQ